MSLKVYERPVRAHGPEWACGKNKAALWRGYCESPGVGGEEMGRVILSAQTRALSWGDFSLIS